MAGRTRFLKKEAGTAELGHHWVATETGHKGKKQREVAMELLPFLMHFKFFNPKSAYTSIYYFY